MHRKLIVGVACATLASLTAAAAATHDVRRAGPDGPRPGGVKPFVSAGTIIRTARDGPKARRSATSRFPDVCETYVKIVESPGDTTIRGVVRVAVEFGNKQTEPACLEDFEQDPNPATFTFSVNGVDRSAAFHQESGHEHITMASDTLRLGAFGAVTLRATIAGHDTQSTPRTDVDSLVTQLVPDYTVFVSGRGDIYQPRATAPDSVAFEISNTGNQSAVQYALTPHVSGAMTYDGGVPASVTLSSGERRTVFARLHASGPGVSGTVSLVASNGAFSGRDSGWVTLRTPSVQVGPKSAVAKPRAAGLTTEYAFTVQNTGYDSASFTLTPVCSGSGVNTSPCTASLSSAALAPGEARSVKVTAQASSSVSSSGQVQLRAVHNVDGGVRDSAITNVTVVSNAGNTGSASTVAMVTPYGNRMARAACPTLGAGANGAVQCGDLLYAHVFPAYRSMNKARAVTMLYNGATADPRPIVAVDYTVPANAYVERFNLQVWRTDGAPTKIADVIYSNPQPGSTIPLTFRVGAALDAAALGMTTGAYPVEARVYRMNNGAWDMNTAATASARLLVVDRSASPFGAGWWPAGVERIFVASDSSAMLVTGDGSALYYAKQSNGSFATPQGEHATLTWESGPKRFKRTMPGGRAWVYYDSTGHVTSVQDNSGNSASYTWQGEKPTVLTDAVGKTVTFNFATAGQVGVAIPGVSASLLTLNSSGNLASITDPDNFVTSFSYASGTHRMTQSAARATAPVAYGYDALGRVASTTVSVTGTVRNFRSWQLVAVPSAGTGTSGSPAPAANVDTAFQRMSWTRGSATDVALFRVDRSGAPVWIVTPGVGTTRLERDSLGQVTRVIDPTGLERQQQWDTAGRVYRQIQLTWLLSGAVRPDTTLYDYHPVWQSVTSIRTPLGVTTMIAYDNLGRQQSVTNAAGEVTQFTYTSRGQVETIREPGPTSGQETYATTYVYDPVTFNLKSVSDSVPNVVQYEYDATNGSDVNAVIDAVGARTEYQYDGIKRVTQVRTAPGNARGALASSIPSTKASVVLYGYDDVNRVRTQTDPNGMVSRWQHDGLGRVTSFCPRAIENWCESTTYGDGLNPTSLVNKKGEQITQSFDAAGRVVERRFGFGSQDDVIRFSYDSRGNATSITNKYATIFRSYDQVGNLIWESEAIKNWGSSDMREVATYHFYDADNRRVKTYLGNTTWLTKGTPCELIPEDQMDSGRPCGVMLPASTDSITYAYDLAGRLTSITNTLWKVKTTATGPKKWEYAYDRKGRLLGLRVPTATADLNNVTYAYDADDRLVSQSEYVHVYGMTRDELGRVLHLTQGGGTYEDFTYDGMARLRFHSGLSMATESFDYDSTGNRTYSGNANFQAESWSYHYDARGQLDQQTPAAPSSTADRQHLYGYDGNGAQVLDSAVGQVPYGKLQYRKLFYNKGGQLDSTITAVWPDRVGTIPPQSPDIEKRTFWYDGLGRRIFTLSTGTYAKDRGAWKYWWLGDQVAVKTRNIADTSVAYTTSSGSTRYVDLLLPFMQRDSVGNLVGEGEWFYYGPGVDNVLGSWYQRRGSGTPRRIFYNDYRGSVRYIATDNGRTMAMSTENYSAYGAPAGGSGESVTNPGFNGQEQAGGLVYMRNRWYDPNTGRFTQQDPIGFGGGINLYAYTGNDPVNFSDPFGLKADSIDHVDRELKKYIRDCMADAECRKTYRKMQETPQHIRIVKEDGTCKGDVACVEVERDENGNRVPNAPATIYIADHVIGPMISEPNWRFSGRTLIQHEGGGHILAKCDNEPCARAVENVVRINSSLPLRDLGIPLPVVK